MRVLHVFDHSLPHQSGYVYRSLGIVRAQEAQGFDVRLLTGPRQGNGPLAREEVEGRRFLRTPDPGGGARLPLREVRRYRALRRRAAEAIAEVRPDVVHVHSPFLNALPVLHARGRGGPAVVYEMRATWEDAAVSHGTLAENGALYRLARAAETRVFRQADGVVTICDGLRADVVARGIAAGKVDVVRNFVSIPRDREDAAPAAAPGPADREKLVLGYIGSFYGYEGIELLVELAARPWAARRAAEIHLIGGGPEHSRIQDLAKSLGVADKVHFHGRLPNAEVGAWYARFDFLVLPRRSIRLTEITTPLKPLEAIAYGCPVVASDIGGHRELLEDGANGHLFAPDDVADLERVLDAAVARSGERAAWIARARERLRARHDPDAIGALYAGIYDKALKGRH